MLKLVRQCAPWLDRKIAGVAALAAVGIGLCLGAPALGLLAGIAPLLLVIACLVPCLAPLALLRRRGRGVGPAADSTLSAEPAPALCGCEQATCSAHADSACQSGRADVAR